MTTKSPQQQDSDRNAVLDAINNGHKTVEAIAAQTGLDKDQALEHAIDLVGSRLVSCYQVRGRWWILHYRFLPVRPGRPGGIDRNPAPEERIPGDRDPV